MNADYISAEEIAIRYHAYRHEHGISAQTHWIIGRRALLWVRQARNANGCYLYMDVITPTVTHHTLMGLGFELSESDIDALYLEERA